MRSLGSKEVLRTRRCWSVSYELNYPDHTSTRARFGARARRGQLLYLVSAAYVRGGRTVQYMYAQQELGTVYCVRVYTCVLFGNSKKMRGCQRGRFSARSAIAATALRRRRRRLTVRNAQSLSRCHSGAHSDGTQTQCLSRVGCTDGAGVTPGPPRCSQHREGSAAVHIMTPFLNFCRHPVRRRRYHLLPLCFG